MRKKGIEPKTPKFRESDWNNDVPRYKPSWLADVFKSTYSVKEKSTVRKVMIPVSLIYKFWKGIFNK